MGHGIEYAKSGRSSCQRCRKKIEKGELRFMLERIVYGQSSFSYYHLECAARSHPEKLRAVLDSSLLEQPKIEALITIIEAETQKLREIENQEYLLPLAKQDNYPFVYLGHGFGTYRKCLECYICFKDNVDHANREKIEAIIPEGLSDFFNWEGNVLHFGSDDALPYWAQQEVQKQSGETIDKLNKKVWFDFHAIIDACIVAVHTLQPISFIIKGTEADYTFDDWHSWSVDTIGSQLGYFDAYVKYVVKHHNQHKEPVEESTASWMLEAMLDYEPYLSAGFPDAANLQLLEILHNTKSGYNHILPLLDNISEINTITYLEDNLDLNAVLYALSSQEKYIKRIFPDHQAFVAFIIQKIKTTNTFDWEINQLGDVILSCSKQDRARIIGTLPPYSQLILLSESKSTANMIFDLTDDPIAYLQDILETVNEPMTGHLLYLLGLKLTDNPEKPKLVLSIMELAMKFKLFTASGYVNIASLYEREGRLEEAISVLNKPLEQNLFDEKALSMLICYALKTGDHAQIENCRSIFLNEKNVKPSTLMFTIQELNKKNDKGIAKTTIKLIHAYWERPDKELWQYFYIVLTDAYIIAEIIDDVLEEIAEAVVALIEKDSKHFDKDYKIRICTNLAAFYTMKGDEEKAVFYSKMTK